MYTLGQAAKVTGISKAWLSKAIHKGRISANKDEFGRYQSDPSELHRVFPLVNSESGNSEQEETQETANKNTDLSLTVEHLRELLHRSAGEIRRLTLLLTDQRTTTVPLQADPEPLPTPADFLGASVRFWFVLALVTTSAAAWLWWAG